MSLIGILKWHELVHTNKSVLENFPVLYKLVNKITLIFKIL